MGSRLHLVDEQGRPLDGHIVEAIEGLQPRITNRFSRWCDPAELDNCLEDGARRIARHEAKHGRLPNIKGFAWRTLFNAVLSLIRLRSRETLLSPNVWESLTGVRNVRLSDDSLYDMIATNEILARMSERDRIICGLTIQGFTSREVASRLGVDASVVRKALSRLFARLTGQRRVH